MKLKKKYIIGTHVMFYEIEALKDFVQSYKNAMDEVENKENVTFELFYNMSEMFETIDTDQISRAELLGKYDNICEDLEKNGYPITRVIYEDSKPYSIGSYRRELNDKGCDYNDFVIWGETDMLFPKELFQAIETVSDYATQQNIHRYCLTFAVRKMWGDDWKVLEHNDFTNSKFTEMHDNLWQNDPSSIWYPMNIDEMNKINAKSEEFDIGLIDYPRFDGSGLIISSDLIQNGINIPRAVWACGEDTSFQNMIKIIMGNAYRQFIIKNILKVHNRNHPNKREYIKGESHMKGKSVKTKRNTNEIWQIVHKLSENNLHNLGPKQSKFNKFEDINPFITL
tara:strand:- start:38 stop:1054 length:1017 start_codon:yes stop_codon:yes gene_type:complete